MMDFNTTLNYLEEEDLNKCGFSWRSLSSISFNKGKAVFSISSIRSAVKSFAGKWVSSKTMYFGETWRKGIDLNQIRYFIFFETSFFRKAVIFLLGIFSAGKARISSQLISGIVFPFFEFGFVIVFPDLRLIGNCYYFIHK